MFCIYIFYDEQQAIMHVQVYSYFAVLSAYQFMALGFAAKLNFCECFISYSGRCLSSDHVTITGSCTTGLQQQNRSQQIDMSSVYWDSWSKPEDAVFDHDVNKNVRSDKDPEENGAFFLGLAKAIMSVLVTWTYFLSAIYERMPENLLHPSSRKLS